MTRTMFDLCGADQRLRFSPFCWRVRLALAHKGLEAETRAWHFTDKQAIAFSGQQKVPVLVDEDDEVIVDSFDIMAWLDDKYPVVSLLGEGEAQRRARFIKHWAEGALAPAIMKIAILDVFAAIDPKDRDYFRESREQRLGSRLEDFQDAQEGARLLDAALKPLRAQLEDAPFIDGERPGGADYLAFGMFMLPRVVRPQPLLEEGDAAHGWHERMLDLFDGMARNAPRVSG
ncbi:glutathione S-transferase N-terminal domain-containing protein [Kushneria aurantia]|uniref:Glutathione S-transferase N-terminal domain-containing protein n=1 Tax=Kushneria aurantia TaxID=504092 RepID=A0ABV6G9T1_9GAMM|nr:glutathione S-transferase N-terminal domain-containing protein [Kushneria aurantia]